MALVSREECSLESSYILPLNGAGRAHTGEAKEDENGKEEAISSSADPFVLSKSPSPPPISTPAARLARSKIKSKVMMRTMRKKKDFSKLICFVKQFDLSHYVIMF
ncbi:unnamed protein product [Cuscuta epithymum]|uniref:Uncharacterized protein n=1 Tax=Cuscuta epithymum TaxID=186058 RepID=A0AAV0C8B1_9ASTE|nr:unnamed protein product [Cuscuta epithymum]